MSKIKLPESITVKDFAEKLEKSVSETISLLMNNGFLVTINEEIDFETATIIAEDLGFEVGKEKVKKLKDNVEDISELIEIIANDQKQKIGKKIKLRPPIVTILGHVDHGKTTLLDTIRRSQVAESESGGITQHITAYQVKIKGKIITFVDTPGHEAFQKMRSRGAIVADIAIVIIAADDGVKPQTKEVLDRVKSSGLPFIVCLNKIDKPEANIDRVKGQLAEENILVEGWGGKIPVVEISAKNNQNIDELLETVLLVAEIEELKADYERPGMGLTLEAHLDKKRGPITTLIVKSGLFRQGDYIQAGHVFGKIKMLEDFQGQKIKVASPSMPVVILGFTHLPMAGSLAKVTLKNVSHKTKESLALAVANSKGRTSPLKRIEKSLETEKYKKLNILIKADTQGSLEALTQILENLAVEDVVTKIIQAEVGQINESDILRAKISQAIPYGFRVVESATALEVQEKEKVKARIFDVIYRLVEDVQAEMKKIITFEKVREDHGKMKVLAIFRTGKKNMIVGGRIIQGKLAKNDDIEIVRQNEIIGKGIIKQIKKGKEDIDLALENDECGIDYEAVGSFVKILEGDEILAYSFQEKTLSEK